MNGLIHNNTAIGYTLSYTHHFDQGAFQNKEKKGVFNKHTIKI